MQTVFYFFERSKKLGDSVVKCLGNTDNIEVGSFETNIFSDSETKLVAKDNVAGKKVIILCSNTQPVNDSVMRLLILIDGLKRGGAEEIIFIAPYLGYSRQDRQQFPNEPVTVQLFVNLLKTAGVDKIYRFDPHSEYNADFFSIPVISVTTEALFANYFENLFKTTRILPSNVVVLSPDHGAINRGKTLQSLLKGVGFASITKKRVGPDQIKTIGFEGNIKNKIALIFDDISSSGQTIIEAVGVARKQGAKKVFIAVSHAVFSTQASEKLCLLKVNDFVVTNSIESNTMKGTHIIDIAPLVADIIKNEAI